MSLKPTTKGSKIEFLTTKRPPTYGQNGAVTSPHYLATQAGKEILEKGGHAVDAAITINTVLTVVYPHMSGLGGDLMALIYDTNTDKLTEMNGSGQAGESVNLEKFNGYDEIPERGPKSALTVPGAVGAWWKLHQKYGKVSWEELFTQAITYATEGFPISKSLSDYINEKEAILKENAESYRTFLPDGKVPAEGTIFKQSDLAESLQLIAEKGPDAFYNGAITERIIASMEKHGGFLTAKDFDNYRAEWNAPIHTDYRGYEIWQTRPNTQGAVATIMLNILEHFDLNELGDNSPEYYHLMTEATKLAFLYRDKFIADEKILDLDPELFTKNKLGEQLAKQIRFDGLAEENIDRKDLPHFKSSKDTTYLAVIDKEGNACSLIQSIYHEFGSAFMPEGTGILLHNRGESFELDSKHINCLEPNKKPFHTIIPAMMTKDGKPVMLYGSMGGEGQPQTQSAIVTRVVDFGYNIQQAIESPRWLFGRTWGSDSDSLKLESSISDETIMILDGLGHETEIVFEGSDELGHAQGIIIDRENKVYSAGADPRGDGIGLSW